MVIVATTAEMQTVRKIEIIEPTEATVLNKIARLEVQRKGRPQTTVAEIME